MTRNEARGLTILIGTIILLGIYIFSTIPPVALAGVGLGALALLAIWLLSHSRTGLQAGESPLDRSTMQAQSHTSDITNGSPAALLLLQDIERLKHEIMKKESELRSLVREEAGLKRELAKKESELRSLLGDEARN